MDKNNYSFNVFSKISEEDRINWHLFIDAIYRADPNKSNMSSEVLSKLLGVKNQGGFRYLGKTSCPKLVVMFTSGDDIYWKDEIDTSTGIFLYYGDNKTPGTDLHKTNLHGNEILRYVFELANSQEENTRKLIPPILVFKKANSRDVKFLGLAVPGVKGRPSKDWLTAVWGQNYNGDRFQNYKAMFTILDTTSGSEFEMGFGINLAWITDIVNGNAYESKFAPKEWKRFIDGKKYLSLFSKSTKIVRNKEEQLPDTTVKMEILNEIHQYFIQKDHGYGFEQFSADIIQYMDHSVFDIFVTRPMKDGGIDAEGKYRLFNNVENVILVDFYMQAKCYSPDNGIGVSETSRIISRLKNRQFGVLITTSYIQKQAYEELLNDGHPLVLITGGNIADYIYNELELRDKESLRTWLMKNY